MMYSRNSNAMRVDRYGDPAFIPLSKIGVMYTTESPGLVAQ
jgi:hypothetical protein